jgi:glycosyltransferase involved in cell wall biosynthesis
MSQLPKLRVLVATPFGKGGQGGIDRLNDTIFQTLEKRSDIKLTRLVTRGKLGLLAAQFIFAWAMLRFSARLLLGQVDVVHIHLSDRGSSYRKTILGALSYFFGVPYVVHLHGVYFHEGWLPRSSSLSTAIDKLFLRSSSIIVLGQVWSNLITDRVPEVVAKIVVLPNATRKFALSRERSGGKVRISCVGRLGARKGSQILIEALSKLADREDWNATLAGDGAIIACRKHASDAGLADRICIPGWLDENETQRLLQRTDILALPSFAENLPMAVIEALAAGIAVVSTPVGAIPEVIDHERNGLLVPIGDSNALAQALTRLIDDPALRRRLGEAARTDHAERYDIDKYVSTLATIWRHAALGGLSIPAVARSP